MRGFFSPAATIRWMSGGNGPVRKIVGVEVLGLGIARRLDPALVGGLVVAHHHHRRMIVALDQQARLVPDAERERPHRPGHALAAQPILGGGEQRVGDRLVGRLEHAPLAEAGGHMLEHELVDLGRDAADDLVAAPGEEEGGLGMLEPGVLARRDQAVAPRRGAAESSSDRRR